MINSNLIKELLPNDDPNYFIAIRDITQTNECNQDSIKFTLHQINKNLFEVEENSIVTEKVLSINSNLEIDKNGLYKTKLLGYESITKKNPTENTSSTNSVSSHKIEMIQTTLSKKIDIDFTEPYTDIPSIIVNIDKQYELLYRSYSCEYKKNKEDKYTGVIVFFNNLKTRNNYPQLKITIIGDLKEIDDETVEEEENNETVEEEENNETVEEEENGSNTNTGNN